MTRKEDTLAGRAASRLEPSTRLSDTELLSTWESTESGHARACCCFITMYCVLSNEARGKLLTRAAKIVQPKNGSGRLFVYRTTC